MKKSTRIISLLLALALTFGCISVTSFASDAAPEAKGTESTIPTASGIKTVAEIDSLATAGEIEKIHTTAVTKDATSSMKNHGMYGTDPADTWHSVETSDGSGDYYLSFGKANGTSFGDTYLQANASNTSTFTQIKTNFDAYRGRSFVVSFDIKVTESFADFYSSITLFQFGTYLHVKNTAAALRTYIGSISKDGTINVSGTLVKGTLPKITVGDSDFATLSIFVIPETNTYNFYLNGELYAKDATFMADPSLVAGLQIDGDTVSTEKDYVPSWLRMLSGTPLSAVTEELIGFDNFKFYYSDTYIECAEHNFTISGDGHQHDFENDTVNTLYVCENCYCEYAEKIPFDADGDSKCDACVSACASEASYHSFDSIKNNITSLGSTISSSSDLNDVKPTIDAAGNWHTETDEWGNNYVSLGKTKDTSKSTNVYHNFYFNNSVNFSNLKSNATRGKAFVIQMDLRLEEGFGAANYNLIEIATYVRDGINNKATSAEGVKSDVLTDYPAASTSSIKHTPLSVTKDGYIKASNFSGNGTVSDVKLSYDEFTTVAVHVDPAKNTYSVYMDGVYVGTTKNWLSWANIDSMTFENADGSVKVNGGEDYILGYARFFQNNVNNQNQYVLSMDNFAIYYTDDYASTYTPKYHDRTLKAITDEAEGYFTLTYKCNECGDINKIAAKGQNLGLGAAILSRSADLGEYIGFKLYAEVTDALAEDETAEVVIAVGDEVKETLSVSALKDYTFYVPITSTEMSDKISLSIASIDGESEAYTTSFTEYAAALIALTEDEALEKLVKTAVSYGAYAQDYFALITDTAFENVTERYFNEDYLAEFAEELVTTAPDISVDAQGTPAPIGATLILADKLSIKIFISGDVTRAYTDDGDLEIVSGSKTSYIVLEGLMPSAFSAKTEIILENAGGSSSIKISAYDCASLVYQNNTFSAEFKNLALALYAYGEAAAEYTAG